MSMINDMLDIAKMEGGSLTLEKAEHEIAHLISLATRPLSEILLVENQLLEVKIAEGLDRLMADEDKLVRTLINLLSNAQKFTPRGGTIRVEVERWTEENALRFAVRDTGEGIPPEAFHAIFEKFGQVESRKAGRKMSTGLGLTFCRMAVEAHDGRIWVESELGKGSTFFFTVPFDSNFLTSAVPATS